ncbi:hypothetical protein Bbelb_313450, partial [Branchiostoma belcheri]
MKNLELVQCVHQESIPVRLGVPCCITVDSDTGSVYVGTDTGLVALDGETQSILCSVSLRETAYLCEDDTSHLVGIQFLQDQDSVCAATSSGDVILWNILTQELECVGTVASGLTCMAWSPNQDLVLLTTGEEKMVMMTSDFNPIFETNIHQEEFGEDVAMQSWKTAFSAYFQTEKSRPRALISAEANNQSETPFSVTRAITPAVIPRRHCCAVTQRFYRNQTPLCLTPFECPIAIRIPNHRQIRPADREKQLLTEMFRTIVKPPRGRISPSPEAVSPALPWDDMLPRVSWCRDDFVVSSVSPVDGARRLRMWNRECVLQATSENVSMLGQALCWKPSGSLIASTQRKPHRHKVVFFEKNGLRHGEFVLPFGKDEMKVLELLWNSESTVLAVWLEELCSGEKQADTPSTHVQLWTVSNYHWYLKQSLSFGKDLADKPTAVVWDAEHANRLHVVCHGGRYVMYEWSWVINRTDGRTAQDKSYVAVIDGDKVLLTPFRQLVIPPPMSAYSLQLSTAVNQVLFSPAPGVNDLAAVLTDGTVVFYTLNSQQPEKELPRDTSVCVNAAGGSGFHPTVCMHVQQRTVRLECFMSEEKWRCPQTLHHFVWLAGDELLAVGWDVTSSTSVLYHLGTQEEQATLIHKMPVGGRVYQLCRSCDGQTVAIELTDGTVLRYHMDRIAGCPVLEPWRCQTGQPVRFPVLCSQLGLCTMAGRETVLGLTDRFRFFVNGDEAAIVFDNGFQTDLSSATDEKVRRVERGSRLVTVVPQDTKVILQDTKVILQVRLVTVVPQDTKVLLQDTKVLLQVRLVTVVPQDTKVTLQDTKVTLQVRLVTVVPQDTKVILQDTKVILQVRLVTVVPQDTKVILQDTKVILQVRLVTVVPQDTKVILQDTKVILQVRLVTVVPQDTKVILQDTKVILQVRLVTVVPQDTKVILQDTKVILQVRLVTVVPQDTKVILQDTKVILQVRLVTVVPQDTKVILQVRLVTVVPQDTKVILQDTKVILQVRLVTVVPQDTKVILQMPRGNLETVHPRTLVLGQVQKLIGSHEFLEAFLIMRKHRVNLNLLCDLNPQMFLTCVPELVTQLKDVNYLNLFLTELREEDVTETMYSEYLSSADENSWDLHSHAKMDQVCDAVKKTLEDLDCENPPASRNGQSKAEGDPSRNNPPQSEEGVSAEEALNYVLLLVDVNELFNVALGTYDLRLVLMVAEKSQKDPKEYLPFLKKLQNMEENLQRYTIDLHLKRYHKAAQHLSKCGPDRFADLLALVKEHKLYKSVLQLYTTESKEYKDISEVYGEYLLKKGHVEEAGLVLSRCEEWEKALQAFEQCCNWRQALCVASRLQYSTQQTAQLALRMAGFLRNNSRQGEAAVLLEQYVQDEEGAIITLLEGNQWEEALRVINKYSRIDIIDTNFKPALLE